MSTGVTVVIPCYRSEAYLEKTADEIIAVTKMHPDLRMHFILINDCSPDGTFQVISRLCEKYPGQVTGIDLAQNAGQAQAKMAAFGFISDGITVFMDDDGQHDPRGIFPLLSGIRKGYDIVYAQFPETRESFFRRVGSRIAGLLMLAFTKKPPGLRITSFFALGPAALAEMKTYRCRHPFIGGRLFQKGYKSLGVPVPHRERAHGKSGYTLRKLVKRTAELTVLYRIPMKPGDPPPFRIRLVIREDGTRETYPTDL